ncbi:DNA repair protein RecO [Sunxiuqinia sp. sy24]|uniref:DNA repair protein RecO n=1 Tax=Sunxiuqinia sp. sy24 TaxID=3461495 RepID=UPI00404567CB
MLEKTRGIYLHHINYSETSIIACIYTEKFGIQSYLIQGVRKRKGSFSKSLFQSLFLLDMEVYYRPGRDLQRLKDVRLSMPFESMPFEMVKSSQAIFLSEVLLKCLKEEEPNADLFDFLFHAIALLDMKKDGIANFHLAFLFHLTYFLGVSPQASLTPQNLFFDLETAMFSTSEPLHNQFMNAETTANFKQLFQFDLGKIEQITMSNRERSVLLNQLLIYYQIHLDLSGSLKSLAVLKEVLA